MSNKFWKRYAAFGVVVSVALGAWWLRGSFVSSIAAPSGDASGIPEGLKQWLALRTSPAGRFDYGLYLAEWKRLEAQRGQAGFAAADPWTFAGPKNLDVANNLFYGTKPCSGRVNAVAIEPGATPKVYIGGAFGGAWVGSDTASWQPISDRIYPLSMVGALAEKGNWVYLGSGDPHTAQNIGPHAVPGATFGTSAVWIYDKLERTWQQSGNAELGTLVDGNGATVRHGAHVSAIEPVREVEGAVLATACFGAPLLSGKNPNGLWRMHRGAWTRVRPEEENFFDLGVGALNPATGRRWYYAVSLNSDKLFRSNDDGKTWSDKAIPATVDGRAAILVEASPWDPNTVYLLGFDSKKVWRSTNAGDTWQDITGAFDPGKVDGKWGQSGYNWMLAVGASTQPDGSKRDIVIAGGIQAMVRKLDGTWAEFTGDSVDSKIHRDIQAARFSPDRPNVAYIGSDGGIYRVTFAADHSWKVKNYMEGEANPQLGVTQLYSVAVAGADHSTIVAGTQDNSAAFATGASMGANRAWQNPVGTGDSGSVDVSLVNPKRSVIAGYAADGSGNFFYTRDDWSEVPRLQADFSVAGDSGMFFPQVMFDSYASGIVYSASERIRIFRYSKGAWDKKVLPRKLGMVTCMATSPTDARDPSDYIYTGAFRGEVYLTKFKQKDFPNVDYQRRIDTGRVPLDHGGRPITSISVDPADPKRILVGVGGTDRDERRSRLFLCADTTLPDETREWQDVTGDLPKIPVTAVSFWPASSTEWWVANDLGVFVKTGNDLKFKDVTANLPLTSFTDIAVVRGSGLVTVSTFGRGIWQARRADLLGAGP